MVPCPRLSIFTLLPNSKLYADEKLPASQEFIIEAILVAINKRNNMNSFVVNYDIQWKALQVLIHVWQLHYYE